MITIKPKDYIYILLFALCINVGMAAEPIPAEKSDPLVALQKQLLELQSKTLDAERQLAEEKLRNQRSEHEMFMETRVSQTSFLAIGGLIGLVVGWLSHLFKINSWVKKKVHEAIKENLDHLVTLVEEKRLDNRLKDEVSYWCCMVKKVMILTWF